MRVLHLLASNKFSGAENVAMQIIDGMIRLGIESAYCSPNGEIKDKIFEKKIIYFPLKKLNVRNLKKIIKLYKPDIIHAHDVRASVIATFSGVPVVSHLHNNDPKMKVLSLKSLLYYYRMGKFYKIISVSNSVWDEFYFKNKTKLVFENISNPINTNQIIELSLVNSSKTIYDIGFVGRLCDQKNPMEFIKIVYELKKVFSNIKVAIIGDGLLRNLVIETIKKYNLSMNVDYFGFVNNPYPIIKNFKILCMTSRWEGFGLVAIEALTLGVPVVCFRVGGLASIVNNDCGCVCDSESEMIKEITMLLSNNSYLVSKSKKSLERSAELDNYSEYCQKIKKIYDNIYKKLNL